MNFHDFIESKVEDAEALFVKHAKITAEANALSVKLKVALGAGPVDISTGRWHDDPRPHHRRYRFHLTPEDPALAMVERPDRSWGRMEDHLARWWTLFVYVGEDKMLVDTFTTLKAAKEKYETMMGMPEDTEHGTTYIKNGRQYKITRVS